MRAALNHLLNAVAAGGIQVMELLPEDDARIAELNDRSADLPGDFGGNPCAGCRFADQRPALDEVARNQASLWWSAAAWTGGLEAGST